MLLTIKIINLYNINNSKFIYISPLGWIIFIKKNIKYYKYIINIL